MYNFCTYFDSNYISHGLSLFKSITKHSEEPINFYVLCLDEKTFQVLTDQKNKNLIPLKLRDIENEYSELLEAKKNRSRIEYYFTLSPVLPLYLIEKLQLDLIASIDADLMFFSSPTPIFQEMGEHSIYITEHRFREKFKSHEIAGKYNVQCQIFRNDKWGLSCLKRWKDQCIDWCFDKFENDKFADQKYLDEWPSRYKNHIVVSENIGIGVAPWNIEGENISFRDKQFFINHKPIIFYHFHGLKIFNKYLAKTGLSGFHAKLTSPVKDLYLNYLNELSSNAITIKKKEIRPGNFGNIRLIMSGIKYRDLILKFS